MKRTKLAGRYAKALFEFAEEINQIDKISEDIVFINDIFHYHKDLRLTINCAAVRIDKKINIINSIFKSRISDVYLRYLTLILHKRREVQITLICEEYVKLYKRFKNIITLDIFSPNALDTDTINEIKNKVKAFTDAETEIIEHIKPTLIGGLAFKFDDYYVDASIKKQIDLLKQELMDKSYQSNF